MSGKSTDKYDEAVRKEAEIKREIAIADVQRWIEEIPADERDTPRVVVGTRVFTPRQLLREVEQDTELGREFGEILDRMRLELAKKER